VFSAVFLTLELRFFYVAHLGLAWGFTEQLGVVDRELPKMGEPQLDSDLLYTTLVASDKNV